MGQYWKPVNLTKKEFINPHKLGSGLKLWEQMANHPGVGTALVVLLAAMPEPRGGGDLGSGQEKVVGRWAGDKVVIIGDYAENGDIKACNPDFRVRVNEELIYGKCHGTSEVTSEFTDITDLVAKVIEHELNGKYVGDGWHKFKYNEGAM